VVPQIIVVPMPITARRRRERGFNQCELLAGEIEKLAMANAAKNIGDDLGTDKRLVVIRDLLVRKIHKSRQTLKDRAERLESAQDIFAVNEEVAHKIKGGPMIIVIDDVITTGGTIRDAVSTLRKAGFENTWGLSVAH
jgi:predicted amidophosphoribosyltransferase